MLTLSEVIEGYFPDAIKDGSEFKARCPVPTHGKGHGDQNPSLKISEFKGRVAFKCWAGCSTASILDAKKIALTNGRRAAKPKAREVARYDYVDESGVHHDTKIRMEPKRFFWENAQTRQPGRSAYRGLYRVKELVEAPLDADVFLVEGEKAVDRLRELGLVAVCPPDGAGADDPGLKWRAHYAKAFTRRRVIVIPDKDAPGVALMAYAVSQIRRVAASVRVVDWFTGNAWSTLDNADVVDYLDDEKASDKATALRSWCMRFDEVDLATPITIDDASAVYKKWFGPNYDITAAHAMLATIASEQLFGDPAWLLIVSGAGATKTEHVMSGRGAGAVVVSEITSPGALISGSSTKEKTKDSTGGLLVEMGERGVLGIKDFTTILSMHHDARSLIFSALREVYDGFYQRRVGSDGAKTLTWAGRLALIGGVTSSWDVHHAAVAAMGDRFLLVRLDSESEAMRAEAFHHALLNTGRENEMRAELADTVGRVIGGLDAARVPKEISKEEMFILGGAANLVTRARTAVELDYRKDVESAHAPEMPARFAKQLLQIFRGACAIGIERREALNLAIRVARDSMPPIRLRILLSVRKLDVNGLGISTTEIKDDLDLPWTTIKRQADALHALGLLTQEVEEEESGDGEERKTRRVYRFRLPAHVEPRFLAVPVCLNPEGGSDPSPLKSSYGVLSVNKEGAKDTVSSDFRGDAPAGGRDDIPF